MALMPYFCKDGRGYREIARRQSVLIPSKLHLTKAWHKAAANDNLSLNIPGIRHKNNKDTVTRMAGRIIEMSLAMKRKYLIPTISTTTLKSTTCLGTTD